MRFGVGSRNDIGGWRRYVGDDGTIDLTLSRCEFKLDDYRRWLERLVLPWLFRWFVPENQRRKQTVYVVAVALGNTAFDRADFGDYLVYNLRWMVRYFHLRSIEQLTCPFISYLLALIRLFPQCPSNRLLEYGFIRFDISPICKYLHR
jgi:hypothetical protein